VLYTAAFSGHPNFIPLDGAGSTEQVYAAEYEKRAQRQFE